MDCKNINMINKALSKQKQLLSSILQLYSYYILLYLLLVSQLNVACCLLSI